MSTCRFNSLTKGSECAACGYRLRKTFTAHPKRNCIAPSTTITQLTPSLWLHQCRNCDWTLEDDSPEPVEHVCGRKDAPKLGDRVEAALTGVGITKERWVAFKRKFGGLPTCNCDERRERLNQLGDELGEAAKAAVAALFGG